MRVTMVPDLESDSQRDIQTRNKNNNNLKCASNDTKRIERQPSVREVAAEFDTGRAGDFHPQCTRTL